VQNNTFGIQKAVSTFERAMTGRVMHSIAFLTLCAAYIEGGLSKLSNIAASLAEMKGFHLHLAGLYLQIIGPAHGDVNVLAASAAFEQARPWLGIYGTIRR
jgi:hypothetical protein